MLANPIVPGGINDYGPIVALAKRPASLKDCNKIEIIR